MAKTVSLKSIFALGKEELASNLKGFKLPKDANEIQKVVDNYLNGLFESDGQYRQNLTESEDYILMSTLQILKSQQSITYEISQAVSRKSANDISQKGNVPNKSNKEFSANPFVTVAGAGVGAVVGGLAGTWGAAIGSIAGTALTIYLLTRNSSKTSFESYENRDENINTDVFVEIVEKICESIDNVIETYRVQVKKVKNVYERREKPSLLNDYSALTDQVANVCRITHVLSESIPSKLVQAVEMMQESLENYDLKYENGKIISEE